MRRSRKSNTSSCQGSRYTANEPLRLINEKTGYAITYELAYFETKAIQGEHHQRLTTYFGYPFFKDITQEEKLKPEKVAKKMEYLKLHSKERENVVKLGIEKSFLFSWDKTYLETIEFYKYLYNN